MTQALCTLLALLLALAGGPLSLCRCGPVEPAVASPEDCCAPPAEAPPAEAGCCCCEPTPRGPTDPAPGLAGQCDCPQLDLSPSPAESAPAASAAPGPPTAHAPLALAPLDAPLVSPLASGGGAIRDGPARLATRPPLYLLHHNLRR